MTKVQNIVTNVKMSPTIRTLVKNTGAQITQDSVFFQDKELSWFVNSIIVKAEEAASLAILDMLTKTDDGNNFPPGMTEYIINKFVIHKIGNAIRKSL